MSWQADETYLLRKAGRCGEKEMRATLKRAVRLLVRLRGTLRILAMEDEYGDKERVEKIQKAHDILDEKMRSLWNLDDKTWEPFDAKQSIKPEKEKA